MYPGTAPESVAHPEGKGDGARERKAGGEVSEGEHNTTSQQIFKVFI